MAGVPLSYFRQQQARYAEPWDLSTRPAMFPFLAEYTNRDTGEKSGGWAAPSMVTEPLNALERLGSGGWSTPHDPSSQQDMTTLLLSLYGGNALNPMASVPKGGLASSAVRDGAPSFIERGFSSLDDVAHVITEQPYYGSTREQMARYPKAQNGAERAYHGTSGDLDGGRFDPSLGGRQNDNAVSTNGGISFDADPLVASEYAKGAAIQKVYNSVNPDATPLSRIENYRIYQALNQRPDLHDGMSVIPVDIYGRGKLLDGGYKDYGPLDLADELSRAKAEGYDYAKFPNENRNGYEYNVWTLGTVKSPYTGEVLFSDTGRPSLMGSAIAAEQPNALEPYYRNGFLTY